MSTVKKVKFILQLCKGSLDFFPVLVSPNLSVQLYISSLPSYTCLILNDITLYPFIATTGINLLYMSLIMTAHFKDNHSKGPCTNSFSVNKYAMEFQLRILASLEYLLT